MSDLAPDAHIDPHAWAALQRRVYDSSLKVWWSREYGYLCLLDPFSGQVIDVANEDAPKWMKRRAFDEKRRQHTARAASAASAARSVAPASQGAGPDAPPDGGAAVEALPLVW
jgi:hypothetical protein